MNDKELTDKVLESISLRMKENALLQELASLDTHLRSLGAQKQNIEAIKRQFTQARDGSLRASEVAKASAVSAVQKAKELMEVADKAMTAAREAEQYVVGLKKLPDFDSQIATIMKGIQQATEGHNAIVKDVNIIRKRKDELKAEGISVPADTAPTPTRVSI